MKIKKITIKGFRGFNKEQSIDFDPRLTLIYAPNSYGKTSISEAFEWLLYGATSKLESADAKDEYKGSYRNLHLPATETAFVSLIVHTGGGEQELLGKLIGEDIERSFDKRVVSHWPFSSEMCDSPKPFVLQHALKNLLLVEPKDRFQAFAKLLGLKDLDDILTNVVKLCTKPEAKIPQEIDKLIRDIEALEKRLEAQESLASINKEYKKGLSNIQNTYDAIIKECLKRVGTESPIKSILPRLINIRDDTISKIFSHSVSIADYAGNEKQYVEDEVDFFLSFAGEEFILKFNKIISLSTLTKLAELANFYDLGMKIIAEHPGKCPFCGRNIDESI
ncbi:MAG: ATP-binding protein, partial [Candidatus Brocadiales bacterium]|nr:ATP-binding protein [Candidatus Brocadiales bacterium]